MTFKETDLLRAVSWGNMPKKSWSGFAVRHRKDETYQREVEGKTILLTDFVLEVGLMEGFLLGGIM